MIRACTWSFTIFIFCNVDADTVSCIIINPSYLLYILSCFDSVVSHREASKLYFHYKIICCVSESKFKPLHTLTRECKVTKLGKNIIIFRSLVCACAVK